MISLDCVGFPAAGYPLSRVGLSLSSFPFFHVLFVVSGSIRLLVAGLASGFVLPISLSAAWSVSQVSSAEHPFFA